MTSCRKMIIVLLHSSCLTTTDGPNTGSFLFPEWTNRIIAGLAFPAEPAMSKFRKFFSAQVLTCKNPWKDKVKDSGLCVHAAGRDAQ